MRTANWHTGLAACANITSAVAVIVSPMNTGAVNFQFWLMNTVPGPGRSVATSACSSPGRQTALDDEFPERRGGGYPLVVVQRVVVARNLGILTHVLGG